MRKPVIQLVFLKHHLIISNHMVLMAEAFKSVDLCPDFGHPPPPETVYESADFPSNAATPRFY